MRRKNDLLLLFFAMALLAMAGGVHESIFNNFLSDTFQMESDTRGALELPRELPGFLVVVMTGVLAALTLTRLGVVAMVLHVCGLLGLAFFGGDYPAMIGFMVLSSAGMHLMQPVSQSLAIELSTPANRGRVMGMMGALGKLGMMIGAGGVWLLLSENRPQYRFGFGVAAGLVALGAVGFLLMRRREAHVEEQPRMVFKRKFTLYYVLELLFGARKQVFLTFGPWVLVKVYGLPATDIAQLYMIGSLCGVGFKPLAGWAIDRFGERAVLVTDGLLLAFVCLGYGYAGVFSDTPAQARLIASGCFILDDMLFALGTGRAIYVSRLTAHARELTSTLAMGVSINHIVSMTIPLAAGWIWLQFGYETLFLGAAVLAVLIALVSSLVPRRAVHLAALTELDEP